MEGLIGAMIWIDWLIVLIPLAVIVFIGFMAQRYVNGVSDFLAAGRKAGRYLISVADGTAGMGLISVVAMFEQYYMTGFAVGFWNGFITVIGLVMTLTGFVTYRYRETRAMTMAQFYEMRYSRGFRIYAGTLAFISGLINYALFPAVGARFLIYFCGFPHSIDIFGLSVSTMGLLMAIFLSVALLIVLTGGQLTTMITDCCQGVFGYIGYTAMVITVCILFSHDEIREAVLVRGGEGANLTGYSYFNPFNIDKIENFNLLYMIIAVFAMIYNRNAWLGSQGYLAAAVNPHEQKMAGVLGSWRAGFTYLAAMLLAIGAFVFINTSSIRWTERAALSQADLNIRVVEDFLLRDGDVTGEQITQVKEEMEQVGYVFAAEVQKPGFIEGIRNEPGNGKHEVSYDLKRHGVEEIMISAGIDAEKAAAIVRSAGTIRTQMLVPVALREIMPVGLTGILCALMFFLLVSTDTTYLHSWGSILAQDVILPIYNKPVSLKAQMTLLRFCIAFVAVFAWFFSFFFSQSDYILQFFALTGTIYLGGAGSCMLGGLYWKKGTTAGAYTAMTVGLFFAVLGFMLNQIWATEVYPYLNETIPAALENFRIMLVELGEMLPIANWEASPEQFAAKFPITSQEIYFLGMIFALLGYIIVSLITCRKDYNMDKLLHRGKYNIEHFVADTADKESVEAEKENKFSIRRNLLGITSEYSRGDRILAWSVIIYSAYSFVVFLVQVVWNIPEEWRWPEHWWFNFWWYYTLPLSIVIGIVTTVWFCWGSTRDLIRLFSALKADYLSNDNTRNDDDGRVKHE